MNVNWLLINMKIYYMELILVHLRTVTGI